MATNIDIIINENDKTTTANIGLAKWRAKCLLKSVVKVEELCFLS
jgi:hypothetical protein